ncbi:MULTISPECIES: hypothetical protein [unclassified Paracoccus (in: a-proteobacteria)]|uniref:hypothetical protein n=1 Tax=unclassified Paracoccus (in: a-proteobacteria) TaxID=2688777 RepID=UPI000687519B|nr:MULTISPECIES: hypothetical protein [unclassified Paracoccus (in: a-proteobacteria)]
MVTLLLLTDLEGIGTIAMDAHALPGTIIGLGMLGASEAFLSYYVIIERLEPVRVSGATYIAPMVALLIDVAVGKRITTLGILAAALSYSPHRWPPTWACPMDGIYRR